MKKYKHDELKFAELREKNVKRCESPLGMNHKLTDWTPLEWAGAAAAECGECANFAKKLRRGDNISLADIGKEAADTVIYLDLLLARLGLDLGAFVRSKFNEVSDRVKCKIKL